MTLPTMCRNNTCILIGKICLRLPTLAMFLIKLCLHSSESTPFTAVLMVENFPHICTQTIELTHLKLCGYTHHGPSLSRFHAFLIPDPHLIHPKLDLIIHSNPVSMHLCRYWRMCQRPLSKFGNLHRHSKWIQLRMRGWVPRHRLWDR